MVVAEVITAIKGLLLALEEANNRLMTKTGKHNERLSASLDAFLARVDGECGEGRVPTDEWLRDLKQLSDDINEHIATCERHTTETGALALIKTVPDNARAKKLCKDVKQLRLSMDFCATPASTPTAN